MLGGLSLSARRAWIEIVDYIIDYATDAVALRKESVDRNSTALASMRVSITVALRKESVDRNEGVIAIKEYSPVALRKESVDRNLNRRFGTIHNTKVALRKESVDRNYYSDKDCDWVRVSLSARRAWIEIRTAETAKTSNAGRSPQGERG